MGDEACFWIRRIYSLFGSVRCHFAFQPRAAPGRCVPYLWPLLCVLISSSQVHSAEAGCRPLRRALIGRFLCRCTPAASRVWHVCCQFGWREFDASLRGNIISSSSHSLQSGLLGSASRQEVVVVAILLNILWFLRGHNTDR